VWCVYRVYGQHVYNVRSSVLLKASSVHQSFKGGKPIRDELLRAKVVVASRRSISRRSSTGRKKHDPLEKVS